MHGCARCWIGVGGGWIVANVSLREVLETVLTRVSSG